jgi:hypothetical protein
MENPFANASANPFANISSSSPIQGNIDQRGQSISLNNNNQTIFHQSRQVLNNNNIIIIVINVNIY